MIMEKIMDELCEIFWNCASWDKEQFVLDFYSGLFREIVYTFFDVYRCSVYVLCS